MISRPLLLTLAVFPLACGDSTAAATDTDTSSSSSSSTTTSDPPPTSTTTESATWSTDGPTTTGTPTTTDAVTSTTTTTTTTDPTATTVDPSTTTTTTSTSTTTTTTGDTDTDGPPPPDVVPDLVCPGDPDGHCDPVPDAVLLAGASVLSIVPGCFEAWTDLDADAEYEPPGEVFRDCGCDRLCPGDPGYVAADDGEDDGEFQASWLAGFHNGRPATGVRGEGLGLVGEGDGLWARALVLEQGNTKLAIVTLDLVGFFNNETMAIRDTLAQMGLEVDYVLLHALHNHEGPDTMGLWGPEQLVSGYDPAYRTQVRQAIVDAIVAADEAKVEVTQMVVGEVDTSTYHANGVGNVINDSRDPFVVDEMIGAVQLVDAEANTIASLVSFGNHPEALSDENTLMTSDFAHGLRRTLEQGSQWLQAPGKPGVGGPCLFLNAAVGGLMTPLGMAVKTPDGETYQSASFEKADAIGQLLGEMALDALANGDTIAAPQLDLQAHLFKLRVDNLNFQAMFQLGIFDRETFMEMDGLYISTEAALINLGPAQFLTVPGELFPELAIGGYDGSHIHAPTKPLVDPNNTNPPNLLEAPDGPYLKDKMHGTYRFIVGMGNDELGYILPEYDFVLGDPPWVSEAEGDHYEETNSIGVETFSKLDAAADVLLAWSKWVHGAP
ncbi:hypothetical protein [Nannocystis bainbridge]|uniref:Neutral/alkaline non-lysosomal ceramidase N-terminal domain-containing protein n=1 Tax=Nannocystis bainbridge TaxID=2995303 RepID=A0ABT5E4K4_9BACT|nr:hypothetical protein [Nannocystis bainbridge]MDC0719687.1 hypothetical protein [Nannocystis bainbridge]